MPTKNFTKPKPPVETESSSPVLKKDLRFAKGVGPARFALLAKLGVQTIGEMLYYFPRRYEDRRHVTPIRQIQFDQKQLVLGKVVQIESFRTRYAKSFFRLLLKDVTGICTAIWMNCPFLKDVFQKDQQIVLYGKPYMKNGEVNFFHPDYEVIDVEGGKRIHTGRVVPFYGLTADLAQRSIRSIQYQLLIDTIPEIEDPLPIAMREKQQLATRKFALKSIHFPGTPEEQVKAQERLVFDEFFFIQLASLFQRGKRLGFAKSKHVISEDVLKQFEKLLPFELTAGQKKAIADLQADFASSRPMQRLLQGEVGSGKTAVAAFAMFATCQKKGQSVLLAPTEILVQQHYVTLLRLFSSLDLGIGILTQAQDSSERERLCKELESGQIQMLVATHAAFQSNIKFKNLQLIVMDEQHKFGVSQREKLEEKAREANFLAMSATPIPRSLANVMLGGMDLTVMGEKPKNRGKIHTLWLNPTERNVAREMIQKKIQEKQQVYVVYPAIQTEENQRFLTLEEGLKIWKKLLPTSSIGHLHGQMVSRDKLKIMKQFQENKIQVLLSTTVIEVGIDVPNATVIVIENAECFGLSQLHQLRGRVGRSKKESYCFVLSEATSDKAQSRLNAFVDTEEGLELADEDLKLRGPGDFFGKRQHGLPQLRIGDFYKDLSSLKRAKEEAEAMYLADPKFQQHPLVWQELEMRFGYLWA